MKTFIVDIIRLKDITDVVTGATPDHLVIKHSQNQSVTIISDSKSYQTLTVLQLRLMQRRPKCKP